VAKGGDGHDVFLPTLYWMSGHSFLDDWDKPLGDLLPKDNSLRGDEIRHRLQVGLREIVRHSAVMCGLPAMDEAGEALVGRLDAILGASGKVGLPAAFYAPVFCLREWLTRPALVELVSSQGWEADKGPCTGGALLPVAVSAPARMTDDEWAAYVQRIGSGK
jgi:hypothetical protein